MHRRRRRHPVPARCHAQGLRRARPGGIRRLARREGPHLRSSTAAGRRYCPYHRHGLVRRPAPRHAGEEHRCQHPGARGPRRAGPRDGRAGPPDRRAWSDPDRRASRHPPAGAQVRRAVAVGGAAGNRHQGDRPDLSVCQGRQDRSVRWRRRGQDREHARADQQHRQGALGSVRVRRRG